MDWFVRRTRRGVTVVLARSSGFGGLSPPVIGVLDPS
jgi:hypothetical protein